MEKLLPALIKVFVYFSTIKNIQPAIINFDWKQSYRYISLNRSDFLHRCFSTSGVMFMASSVDINNPNSPKHLYINSTPDKIVFGGDTAALMLPPFIDVSLGKEVEYPALVSRLNFDSISPLTRVHTHF